MRHSPFTAVYDACVLYPEMLRSFLMHLATSGRYRARWTADIRGEWREAILRARPDVDPAALDRTALLMESAVDDALVTGYEGLIAGLVLPDPDDRHVLAAAIRCGADVIVTVNLRDFPAAALQAYGIEAQHPDEFVEYLFDLDSSAVAAAAQQHRRAMKRPPFSPDDYLDALRRQGLVQTAKLLERFASLI